MLIIYYTFLLSILPNIVFANCAQEPLALPVYSKLIAAKKNSFIEKYGKFEAKKLNKQSLQELCQIPANRNEKLLEKELQYNFVINPKCEVFWGTRSQGNKIPNHTVLASDRAIVSGGTIHCQQTQSNTKETNFLITNYSSRYCFKFKHLTHIIKELENLDISAKNIYLRFKQDKFCAKKKNRITKYQKIISGHYHDYGLKKSHLYRADQFKKLKFPN